MARNLLTINKFYRGISPSNKLGDEGYFNFARNCDIYTEPSQLRLNVATVKDIASTDGGSPVSGLVKWIVTGAPYDDNGYFYTWEGKLLRRTSAGVWSNLRSVANSAGEGLELFNDYIYYTQNTQIGRYGPLSGVPAFTDNWQTGLNGEAVTGAPGVGQFSPIKVFRAGFAVGNGNQLSWWDGSTWTLARLTFPPDCTVQCLEIVDEYLAIAASGATGNNYVFFWDGDAVTFNFFIKVEDGPVQSMINFRNQLFAVIGGKGKIVYLYPEYKKIMEIPNMRRYENFSQFPGSITSWQGLIHFAITSVTNSNHLVQGVYQYGSASDGFPDALNFGYTISQNLTIGVSLGAIKVIDDVMYVSWGVTGVNEGIDKITLFDPPFDQGSIEFLLYDGGDATREDLALSLKAAYSDLAAGEGIQLGYKTNGAASYTLGTADTTVGSNHTRLPVDSDKARFYDFQFEVVLTATGTTSPILHGVSLKSDDLKEEREV